MAIKNNHLLKNEFEKIIKSKLESETIFQKICKE